MSTSLGDRAEVFLPPSFACLTAMFKHLSQILLALEAENSSGEHIYAGKRVKSKSPGSKGLEGKVLSITNDNVLVAFDNGQKLSVPLNHVNLV